MGTGIVTLTLSLGAAVSLLALALVPVLPRVPALLLGLLAIGTPAMLGPRRFPLRLLGTEESTESSEESSQHPPPVNFHSHDFTEGIEAPRIHDCSSEGAPTTRARVLETRPIPINWQRF
jgi:hypothetical protein